LDEQVPVEAAFGYVERSLAAALRAVNLAELAGLHALRHRAQYLKRAFLCDKILVHFIPHNLQQNLEYKRYYKHLNHNAQQYQ
jgi:hypothetical protein